LQYVHVRCICDLRQSEGVRALKYDIVGNASPFHPAEPIRKGGLEKLVGLLQVLKNLCADAGAGVGCGDVRYTPKDKSQKNCDGGRAKDVPGKPFAMPFAILCAMDSLISLLSRLLSGVSMRCSFPRNPFFSVIGIALAHLTWERTGRVSLFLVLWDAIGLPGNSGAM
jgi:hypothetical protein